MLDKILRLACSLLLVACVSSQNGETRLDLRKLQAHVEAAELTFSDTSLAFAQSDPVLAQTLGEIALSLGAIDTSLERAIASGDGAPDTIALIDLFLVATVDLLEITSPDPNVQARARVVIIAARAILVQVRLALEQDQPTPP